MPANSKEKISKTDAQRSIRAYEVKQFTKKSLHDWFQNTKSYFDKDDFYKIYIDYPRAGQRLTVFSNPHTKYVVS